MRKILAMLILAMLAGCASPGLQNQSMVRGFNALQHKNMAWTNPDVSTSFRGMSQVGANAVVLIPFLSQASPTSLEVFYSDAVTREQLKAAIRNAHQFRMQVTVKPQILVRDSWAGAINQADPELLKIWFQNYSREVLACARLAQQEGAHAFVVGTELKQVAARVDWPGLIHQVRQVFHGRISYAAHNVEGVKSFPYWQLLDAVALTLYPPLGNSGDEDEMMALASAEVEKLHDAVRDLNRPLWVMEVGMPSARGASAHPWSWQGLDKESVDLDVQADALEVWLKVLDQPWIDSVYIWAWYSDSKAGGRRDTDYTPQNKPAERVIRRYWNS